MNWKRNLTAATGALALAALAGACGEQTSPTSPTEAVAPTAADATSAKGGRGSIVSNKSGTLYMANLHPLNARAQQVLDPDKESGGPAHGKAFFRILNGMLQVTVEMSGVEPMMIHPQHIHAADRCPPMSADTNGDGFIDVIEGVPFYGPILIPLDGNIENTISEAATFPNPGSDTTYVYTEEGSISAIEAAIGEPLNLSNRHVVVHGVDLDTPLPESVQSLGGLPAQLTLPVACGEIKQVGR